MRPMADRTGLLSNVPAPRPEPAAERTPLAWWHLRTWRVVDRSVLARVRDGLHALAPQSGAAAPLSQAEAETATVAEPVLEAPEAPASKPQAAEAAQPAEAPAAESPAAKAP